MDWNTFTAVTLTTAFCAAVLVWATRRPRRWDFTNPYWVAKTRDGAFDRKYEVRFADDPTPIDDSAHRRDADSRAERCNRAWMLNLDTLRSRHISDLIRDYIKALRPHPDTKSYQWELHYDDDAFKWQWTITQLPTPISAGTYGAIEQDIPGPWRGSADTRADAVNRIRSQLTRLRDDRWLPDLTDCRGTINL